MKSVKTYMNFPDEIDPAHIVTMADLELSIMLATPLVVFNNERQVVSGLAEKWTILSPNRISFTLRKNLKWSDGTPVSAMEYKAALDRAKKLYGSDLKALFDSISKIEALDDHSIIFTTNEDVGKSGILLKLTEPMYGLVALKNGSIDLSKSVGPFFVKERSDTDLILTANKNCYTFSSEMPQMVEIRKPKGGVNVLASFQSDDWPNLTSGSSLMMNETMEQLKSHGYKTWQRSLDKVYGLFSSKRFIQAGGAALMRNLAAKLDRNTLLKGLTGYADAEQFFPRGYDLYSAKQPKTNGSGVWTKKERLEVIMVENPILSGMKEELSKFLSKIVGVNLKIEWIPLSKMDERMKRGDFDILAASLAVADPNFDGAMSFFIEREPAFIQSTSGQNDFANQLRLARSLPTATERANQMRDIIIRAQEAGHVLPLFHFSSLAIAKPGVDLSEIPNTDETVLFSKVRMR